MSRFSTLSLLLSALFTFVSADLRRDLQIVDATISPDGFTRPAVLAGGTFPGPVLKANKGDHIQINVVNKLNNPDMLQSTSIHWHGFFQRNTQWADGPAFITQCPIATNHSFLYDFYAHDQAGTFWYHSHLHTQYCDGLRGAFVVYDPFDPYKHLYDIDDDSTVITLADWYHILARQETGIPASDATLINGLGRYTGGPASPLSVVNVQHGKRYRFRLVSISCDPNFTFSIDGHKLTVIESDGISVQPYQVDSIQIFAAQRYSFVLNANQPVNNYWIRALPNIGPVGFDGGVNSAILRYAGAPVADPTTTQVNGTLLLETGLHPLVAPGAPGKPVQGGADVPLNLALTFNFTTFKFQINGVTFEPPSVPVLLQVLSGKQDARDLLPAGSVYTLPRNKVVELTLPGGVIGGGHPFHLHGHAFDVVRSAGSSTYNYINPARRDVVNIGGAGDNVTIRFRTDNPGPWFFHCHIDWHLEAGFAIVFAEDTPDFQHAPHPPQWDQLCPIYDALSPDQQ
ncbi:laccase [Rickenella mellea]|uniref:laccase n=1 Tax=Rickenella mellea TaxID=50990 RepID=A0A4Y7QGK8_9AGAM|nr:laccase [Rickenella mellea]